MVYTLPFSSLRQAKVKEISVMKISRMYPNDKRSPVLFVYLFDPFPHLSLPLSELTCIFPNPCKPGRDIPEGRICPLAAECSSKHLSIYAQRLAACERDRASALAPPETIKFNETFIRTRTVMMEYFIPLLYFRLSVLALRKALLRIYMSGPL